MIRTDFSIHPSVATLTLDRPERRNALSAPLVEALRDRIAELGRDAAVRAIVLTGEGSVFSAGADLDALRRLQEADREENLADSRLLASLFEAMVRCEVPIVARVNGHAIAGGCGLAALCDWTVAVDSARFGFTEVRIGFVPALVFAYLRHRVRLADLRTLLLGGALVDAEEARRLGLVTHVVAPEGLDDTVLEIARRVGRETSREAVARTRAMLSTGMDIPHAEAVAAAIERNADARSTPDCRAGIAAFLEKTDPPWHRIWDDGV